MALFINLFKWRIIFNIRKQQYLYIPVPAFRLQNSSAQAGAFRLLQGAGELTPLSNPAWVKRGRVRLALGDVQYLLLALPHPTATQRPYSSVKNATGQEHARPPASSWQAAIYIPIYLTTSVSHVWIPSSWLKPLLLTEGAILNLMRTRRCSSICNHNKNKQLLRP